MGNLVYSCNKLTQQRSALRMLHARQTLNERDLEDHGFKSDIPKAPNNYLMCSQAHMVEMDLKTNFLWAKLLTANRDTELMQIVLPGPYHGTLNGKCLLFWKVWLSGLLFAQDAMHLASVRTQERESVVEVYVPEDKAWNKLFHKDANTR